MPICPFIGLSVYWRRPVPICRFIGLSVYRRRPVPICPFIGLSVYRRRPVPICPFIGLSAQAGADLSFYRFIGLSAQAGKNRPCHHAGNIYIIYNILYPYAIGMMSVFSQTLAVQKTPLSTVTLEPSWNFEA